MARQKFCFVIASVVAVSILFNSVVYACSKFAPAPVPAQLASMDSMAGMHEGMIERGPCAKHKQDICKSVRDRTRSVQPVVYKSVDPPHEPVLFLATNPKIVVPEQLDLTAGSADWQSAFHAVFKLPLPYSLRVLRI